MEDTERVLGYARTPPGIDDKYKTPIPEQKDSIVNHANDNDYTTIIETYEDKGTNGHNDNPRERPAFKELVEHLKDNENITTVLVKSAACLSRNTGRSVTAMEHELGEFILEQEITFIETDPMLPYVEYITSDDPVKQAMGRKMRRDVQFMKEITAVMREQDDTDE